MTTTRHDLLAELRQLIVEQRRLADALTNVVAEVERRDREGSDG